MAARELPLRDLLAAHALAGLLAYAAAEGITDRQAALRSYMLADQMLDARDIDPAALADEHRRARRDG